MAKEDGNEVGTVEGEYNRPDAEQAFKIFDKEIKPKLSLIAEKRGDCAEPYSRIKDNCHYPRSVLNFIVALENMEDDKRDHHLLALSEGLKARRIFMPRDLVTMANGEEDTNVVPIGKRRDSGLGELAGEMASDEFQEMAESEMAQQAGRPSVEQAQAEADAETESEADAAA